MSVEKLAYRYGLDLAAAERGYSAFSEFEKSAAFRDHLKELALVGSMAAAGAHGLEQSGIHEVRAIGRQAMEQAATTHAWDRARQVANKAELNANPDITALHVSSNLARDMDGAAQAKRSLLPPSPYTPFYQAEHLQGESDMNFHKALGIGTNIENSATNHAIRSALPTGSPFSALGLPPQHMRYEEIERLAGPAMRE